MRSVPLLQLRVGDFIQDVRLGAVVEHEDRLADGVVAALGEDVRPEVVVDCAGGETVVLRNLSVGALCVSRWGWGWGWGCSLHSNARDRICSVKEANASSVDAACGGDPLS